MKERPLTFSAAVRCAVGGVLMGLANLVPGISGGTMLLAAGAYPRFIKAVADVSSLRFRVTDFAVLAVVGGCAALAIGTLAGTVKTLVVDHRWVMYSLFIGLTLGGVPVVWNLIRKHGRRADGRVYGGAVAGALVMVLLVYLQYQGGGSVSRSGLLMMFVAGIAGASAMILPGVSGGYLFLLLGVYVPILTGIDEFKSALQSGSLSALTDPLVSVVIPVGLGVVVGVAVVSNLLEWLFDRYERATLGFLLGLLIGAVVGLWPFQQPRSPAEGELIKGQMVTLTDSGPEFAESGDPVDREDWPTVFFEPRGGQLGGSLGLIFAGFVATWGVSRLGREKDPDSSLGNATNVAED